MSVITMEKGDTKVSRNVKRLRKYRVDAGHTIYSLAERLGVHFSTISYWEKGKIFPRQQKMMELEDFFKASYRDLFSDLSEEDLQELEKRDR